MKLWEPGFQAVFPVLQSSGLGSSPSSRLRDVAWGPRTAGKGKLSGSGLVDCGQRDEGRRAHRLRSKALKSFSRTRSDRADFSRSLSNHRSSPAGPAPARAFHSLWSACRGSRASLLEQPSVIETSLGGSSSASAVLDSGDCALLRAFQAVVCPGRPP